MRFLIEIFALTIFAFTSKPILATEELFPFRMPYEKGNYLCLGSNKNCIALATYFSVRYVNTIEKANDKVTYDDISDLVKKTFNSSSCSIYELQKFLRKFNVDTDAVYFTKKSKIFRCGAKALILYLEPNSDKDNGIGHFAFCMFDHGDFYVFDPILIDGLKRKLIDCEDVKKRWEGCALWIRNR